MTMDGLRLLAHDLTAFGVALVGVAAYDSGYKAIAFFLALAAGYLFGKPAKP